MKTKTVFAASLLLAGVAFADATTVDSSYVLGVMPVKADGKSQVILSIPWVAEGGTNTIAVTNLVKTAGLTAGTENDDKTGDTLTWYDTTEKKYQQWRVVSGGEDKPGYWTPVTVTEDTDSYATPAENATLLRGQAVVLTRKGTGDALSNPIYVIGQVGTNVTTSTTISGNSWHLLAPPAASTSEVDFNTVASVHGKSDWADCVNDTIVVDAMNGLFLQYTCFDLGNDKSPRYVWAASRYARDKTAKIPAGRGFWYNRKNNDRVTLEWKNVPSVTSAE